MQVTVPDPALVLLVGPSGSGKSTFAHREFEANEVISSDALRAMLADDPADQEASAEAFRIVGLLANGRLKRRLMTVIDATNLRAVNRRQYRSIATRNGVPVVAICFDLPPELFEVHNRSRPDRVVDAAVVGEQVERMREAMSDIGEERYYAVHVVSDGQETSNLSIGRWRAFPR